MCTFPYAAAKPILSPYDDLKKRLNDLKSLPVHRLSVVILTFSGPLGLWDSPF